MSRHSSSQRRPLFDNSHKEPPFNVKIACEQALHLGDIMKSTCARGTREARSLAQIGELARRLMRRFNGHLKKVVAYENRQTGGLLWRRCLNTSNFWKISYYM